MSWCKVMNVMFEGVNNLTELETILIRGKYKIEIVPKGGWHGKDDREILIIREETK